MNIFTIGGVGLVGSRVSEVLKDRFNFTDLSRASGVDITNKQSLDVIAQDKNHEWLILYAAKTDVDGCEKDKELGENGEAWRVNVTGVRNVVDACKKNNKKLIYLSTDLVFPGERGNYVEDDKTDPQDWYAVTKAEGEKVVKGSGLHSLILRIAFPYSFFGVKKHFVSAMYNRLSAGLPLKGITDETFTPTWLDDLSQAIDVLISRDVDGVYHIGGADALTPYQIALEIADIFNFDKSLISPTTRQEYFAGKAFRPFNTSLNSGKIQNLGVKLHSLRQSLRLINQQK